LPPPGARKFAVIVARRCAGAGAVVAPPEALLDESLRDSP
jgi:hypothetical protein